MQGIEIASIYCRRGVPDPQFVRKAFQIAPSSLIATMLGKIKSSGLKIQPETYEVRGQPTIESRTEQISAFLKKSSIGLMMGRNLEALLWRLGPWKSAELDKFIDKVAPDLLFVPLYASAHMNRLVLHIWKRTRVPMVAYVSDDVYSLRRFSLSPIFWIRRIGGRRLIRRVTSQCDSLYVISEEQKAEYQKTLHEECRVLTKIADFSGAQPPEPVRSNKTNENTLFTYVGNIGNGRWKSLRDIGCAIDRGSESGNTGQLDIYTMTPLSHQMKRAFRKCRSIRVHSAVPPSELRSIYEQSDVLVLAEPTGLRGRLKVRHSFSTKIVEYLQASRPILLRAASGQASGEYLRRNEAAMVSTPSDNLQHQVSDLIKSRKLRLKLAHNGWKLGQEKHHIGKELPKLETYLRMLAKETATDSPGVGSIE